jgi:gamma-glutamyltranspeptidase/glutathione hydrolase
VLISLRTQIRGTGFVILVSLLLPAGCTRERVEPVAKQGMVVDITGDGAAAAGRDAMLRGGNAMDAAMTTAMLEPCLTLGRKVSYAGIIAVVYYDAASGKVYDLDADYNTVRGETDPLTIPGPSNGDERADRNFRYKPSGRTALVPGFLAGVEAAHQRFGKRPFAEIVEPAIRCAEDGVRLTPGNFKVLDRQRDVLDRLPETKAIFTRPDGSRYWPFQLLRQPALAETLRAIVRNGVRSHIYEGPWAREFVAAVQRDGGRMTMDDLAAYQPRWIEPVHGHFNGYDVYAHGRPPALGGVQLIEALNIATAAGVSAQPAYGKDPVTLFNLMQIGKVSILLSVPELRDPVAESLDLDLTPQSRLDPRTSTALWNAMRAGKLPRFIKVPQPASEHTDVAIAVDAQGNVAAVVHTMNTRNWGASGIFVGGISIPDSASFQQTTMARLAPGARLPDTLTLGVALKDGKPALGFGSAGEGAHMRTFAALVSTLGRGLTPQQAIDEPGLGMFTAQRGARELVGIVGRGQFDAAYKDALRKLGQPVMEDDASRGYWEGISIDPHTQLLHGGSMRDIGGRRGVAGL